jgi:hypothetical protein
MAEPVKIPALISIEHAGAGHPPAVFIDGEPFGYATTDGWHVHVSTKGMPAVTVTLVADRVEVIDGP